MFCVHDMFYSICLWYPNVLFRCCTHNLKSILYSRIRMRIITFLSVPFKVLKPITIQGSSSESNHHSIVPLLNQCYHRFGSSMAHRMNYLNIDVPLQPIILSDARLKTLHIKRWYTLDISPSWPSNLQTHWCVVALYTLPEPSAEPVTMYCPV